RRRCWRNSAPALPTTRYPDSCSRSTPCRSRLARRWIGGEPRSSPSRRWARRPGEGLAVADEVKVERHGAGLGGTIHRQERMNALSQGVHDRMRETWVSLKSDRSARSIVITGAGNRAFCTGMDLKAFGERGGYRETKADVHEELRLTPMQCDVWLPTI